MKAFLWACLFAALVVSGTAEAKKEIPLAPAFPAPVLDALRCDVCAHAITNVQHQLYGLHQERLAQRLSVREDDILEILEDLCSPMTEGGEWIRRVVIQWEAPEKELGTDVSPHYNKCGSTCRSVSQVCDGVLDMDTADDIPKIYLTLLREKGVSLLNATIAKGVIHLVCGRSPACKERTKALARLSRAASSSQSNLFATVTADVPVEIDSQEMEMERMMHSMWEKDGKRADVFDRSEIQQLQDAIASGNKEEARRIDPRTMDLTDEEFEELRKMYNAGDDGDL